MFDLVIAVETDFYWPDLPADVKEVWRVVEPGGIFTIITEAYKGGKFDQKLQVVSPSRKANLSRILQTPALRSIQRRKKLAMFFHRQV